MIKNRFHSFNSTEQSPQMPFILGFGDSLNFSGFVGIQSFPKYSAKESFFQKVLKRLRKGLCLKNFEQGHCHYFADDPKFIRFEGLKRQSLQVVMIFQFLNPASIHCLL